MEAIARLAGIAKGTIYLYFRSKEEILVALIEDRFARLRTLIRNKLLLTSDSSQPPFPSASDQAPAFDLDKKIEVRESIRRIIDAHFTFYREHQEFIAILYGQLGKIARNMEAPAKCSAEEITQLITGVLTKGVACGVLRPVDPRTLTLALQGMIHAVAFDWAVGQNNLPPDEAAESVFQLFWTGAVRVP
ncbi:MAG TPA: TetR/AcrR family transcriptional regulator [Firmicutes bacterium]|nr:TetR/AcrR family transcriptional regulator [Bacillota bacterium]